MKKSFDLAPIPADVLDQWLPRIGFALESFAERSRGRHSVEYFIQEIRERNFQCWAGVRGDEIGAVALTIVNEDALKTVTITHCAGENARAWVMLLENLKAWARELGSQRFEAITRPGWERLMAPYGFSKTHVVLEVDLDG